MFYLKLTQTLWEQVMDGVSKQYQIATETIQKTLQQKQLDALSWATPEKALKQMPMITPQKHDTVDPLLRLWLLRLLIPLECHRKFIDKYNSFQNDELAILFGFKTHTDTVISISEADIEEAMRMALDELNENEQSEIQSKNAEKDQLSRRKAMMYLTLLHHQAEHQANTCQLPQPLADNIKQLVEQVGLSQVESAILAFAVLMHTNRLLNDVTDWLGREMTTLKVYHTLSVLLGFSEADIRAALSSQATLAQTSLVVLERDHCTDLSSKINVLSRSFADRLSSETGSPVDWLRDMVIPSQAPLLTLADYSHLQDSLDFLQPYLQKVLNNRRKGVNVFLYGAPGTGKTQLTRVLAKLLDHPLYEIASEDNDGDPIKGEHRLRAFRAAQAFFRNSPTLILFDEVEDVFNDGNNYFGTKSTAQTRKAWMNRLLEENPIPTFWLGNTIDSIDPAFIRRFDWVLEVPIPPKAQRERIIRQSCSEVLTTQAIERLAACEELAPAVVTRAAEVIGTLTEQFPVDRLSTTLQQMMDKTLQAQGHTGLNSDQAVRLPDFYDPALINCDADLKQIAEGIRHHGSARICLFGPPGTGKTAYSRWLAEQLGKPLQVKRGADVLSMWVGGTEQNIARIFKAAEQDQAILLIDEIDSFLQDRNGSHHSWEVTAVNEMLTRMESYNGVFIASTNRLEGLDSAALRRFDLKVQFAALKPEQAWTLLESHCQALGLGPPDDSLKNSLHKLDDLTPGDFAALARQHRFRPLKDAQALISALQNECALKTPYHRQPIGFL